MNKPLYYRFKEMFKELMKVDYENVNQLSVAVDIPNETVKNYLGGERLLTEKNALKFCVLMGVKLENAFDPVNMVYTSSNDVSALQLSEQLIVGLKTNIKNRIKPIANADFVSDIMELVNAIVIESSYMGVEAEREKRAWFIIEAAQKRRK